MSNATESETDRGADGSVVITWTGADGAPREARYETPGSWTFVVPDAVTQIHVVARGASGGAGRSAAGDLIPGGGGSLSELDALVNPGEPFPVVVGRGGANAATLNRGGAGGSWSGVTTGAPGASATGGGVGQGFSHTVTYLFGRGGRRSGGGGSGRRP